MSKLYFMLLALLCTLTLCAQTVRTKLGSPASTDWSTTAAWSPTGVPQAGERIVIPTGVTANINGNVTYASLFLDISGTLTFSSNRTLTMTSASSYVNVRLGGVIQASNTSNASTKIVIGGFNQFVGNVTYSSNSGGKGILRGPANATGQSQNFVFGVILAQSLIDFSVTGLDKSVSIRWTVKPNVSNKSFEVLRSTDGKIWSSLAVVPVSNRTASYSLNDASPAAGLNYYRLKTQDADGKSWYSMIRTSYQGVVAGAMKVVPNPAVATTRVIIPATFSTTGAQLRVVDRSGKLVIEQQVARGSKISELDVRKMPAGQYIVQLLAGTGEKSSGTLIVAPH